MLVREGKRVEGGRKKPGTKSRGKKWEEKRLTKKRETLEMIDEVLEVIGNPFEDMSIDEKKRIAVYSFHKRLKVCIVCKIVTIVLKEYFLGKKS